MIPGAFPIIAGKPPATMTLTDTSTNTSSSNTHTHSSMSFGDADPSRYMVIAIAATISSLLTSVTIGGITATLIDVSGTQCYLYGADVPTGTSGSVVLTVASPGFGQSVVALYSLINLVSTTATDTDTNSTSPVATSVSANGGGFVLAAAFINDVTNTGSPAWTGGVTQDTNTLADVGGGDGARLTTAIASVASTGTVTATMTVSLAAGAEGVTASFA